MLNSLSQILKLNFLRCRLVFFIETSAPINKNVKRERGRERQERWSIEEKWKKHNAERMKEYRMRRKQKKFKVSTILLRFNLSFLRWRKVGKKEKERGRRKRNTTRNAWKNLNRKTNIVLVRVVGGDYVCRVEGLKKKINRFFLFFKNIFILRYYYRRWIFLDKFHKKISKIAEFDELRSSVFLFG